MLHYSHYSLGLEEKSATAHNYQPGKVSNHSRAYITLYFTWCIFITILLHCDISKNQTHYTVSDQPPIITTVSVAIDFILSSRFKVTDTRCSECLLTVCMNAVPT